MTGQGMVMSDRDVSEAGADETEVQTVPLEDEDGNDYVIAQQNVGHGDTGGSGEWPHPDALARGPSPGAGG